MALTVKIKRSLHKPGLLDTIKKSINGPKKVKVGFPAGKSAGGEIQKAIWNNFGTRGGGWGGPIPERPFMQNVMKDNRGKYQKNAAKAAKAIIHGQYSMKAALQKFGVQGQGDIQAEITSLSSPPNSPVTISMKGSSNPLIDTGAMRAAVTWDIEE